MTGMYSDQQEELQNLHIQLIEALPLTEMVL